ncbi:MAG: hypothetical protein AABN33_02145 [Acidobacteriota bacterium]
MAEETPAKRRRGGQPGNRNAKGKGGNRSERRHRFARGNRLGGALAGNQNARKKRHAAHIALRKKFEHDPEAVAWIEANASVLDEAGFKEDDERDRALFDGYRGLTPDALAESGQEYRRGLYSVIATNAADDDDEQEDGLANAGIAA